MTLAECLQTRPYICCLGTSYPPISDGEIVYIFGRTKRIRNYYVDFQDYKIIKESEKQCIYLISQCVFESCFKALSNDDLIIKDVLE